jgi:hypothetical protein
MNMARNNSCPIAQSLIHSLKDSIVTISYRTFDVMSPRHCDEFELKFNSLWAVDIHDLLGFFFECLEKVDGISGASLGHGAGFF